jgi:hypothetical protein
MSNKEMHDLIYVYIEESMVLLTQNMFLCQHTWEACRIV